MEKRFRAPFSPRKAKNKPPRKRFVIICEGARTETDYFNHLLKEWRSLFKKVDEYVSIEIRSPKEVEGNEPPTLIEDAVQKLHETEKAKTMWDKSSRIWCVFDVEAVGRRENLTNSVRAAKGKGIKLAISNPCFELWFYLHFRYCDVAVPNGKTMKQLLQKCWRGYDKSGDEFSPLEGKRETATKNAKRLREEPHVKEFKPSSDPVPRPYTDVDVLIAEIEAVLADIR